MNKIKDYEKTHGVNQEVIAQSVLAHADLYKELARKSTEASERFYSLEKANGAEHPETAEAKKEWDERYDEAKKEGMTIREMLNNLAPETVEKYRNKFEANGIMDGN